MAETNLITKEEVRTYHPISKNIDEERINPFILRAQQRELKPFLGDVLYFDFVTKKDEANYLLLLNGTEYEYQGNTIFFGGVKPLLAAFSYGQFLKENPLHVNRAGNKTPNEENSTNVDFQETAVKSNEAKAEAIRLQEECAQYLNAKKAEYPLWQKGSSINEPTKVSVSFTKVPRSVQR